MTHRSLLLPPIAFGVLVISACTPSFGASRIDGGQDIQSPEERRLQTVETKLSELNRRVDGINSLGLDQDTQKLREDLRSLRGDVEKLRNDVDNQAKRSKDQYLDLDRRMQKLESGTIAIGNNNTQASPPVTSPPAQPPSSGGSPEEETAYLTTFDLLKNGKYDEAIKGFKDMTAKWPAGHYADNATYWTGEAYYVKRDYKAALLNFKTVLEKYPSSPKASDAMLKIGLSQIELKQTDKGKATLQRVIDTYPGANAANLARQRLDTLK